MTKENIVTRFIPSMKILHVVVLLLITLFNPVSKVMASPNIVMVFIDDMGWGDFSCFGNKDVQTPNADRLAKEGIRFSQFYVNLFAFALRFSYWPISIPMEDNLFFK
jgi:uncharacterized sulfatase